MNLACDRKFRDFLGSGRALGRLSDTLCVENGLSIIEKPQHTTLTYDKWLGDRAKQPQREEMRATIDEIMRQKPESFDALLSVLREKGWEIKRGKRMSARATGQIRFKRFDSLGEEYSEKMLRAAGAEVLGVVSIFTYGMKKGLERLAAANVKNVSLTNFDVIAAVAAEQNYIKQEDVVRLIQFRNNPADESWIGGNN